MPSFANKLSRKIAKPKSKRGFFFFLTNKITYSFFLAEPEPRRKQSSHLNTSQQHKINASFFLSESEPEVSEDAGGGN